MAESTISHKKYVEFCGKTAPGQSAKLRGGRKAAPLLMIESTASHDREYRFS
jgi:hypothetical protein